MGENQSRDSHFVSLPGIIALILLTVTAVYFRAWMIAAFLLFLSLLCSCSRVWSMGVLKRVEFQAEVMEGSCHVGETMLINLKVRNHSFFPLVWMDVILPTGKRPLVCRAFQKTAVEEGTVEREPEFSWFIIGQEKEAQTGIRDRFVWLLWQQEIQWTERIKGAKRGVVELKGAQLQAGDGFGLSARGMWKELKVPQRLIVYPQIRQVNVQPFLKITQEAVAKNRGQSEDPTILKNVRPYQQGDPMKRINWRHLAGSGRMEVNVYETIMPGCAAFLLDLGSFRGVIKRTGGQGGDYEEIILLEQELEGMISVVASCMQAISQQGIAVALLVPGYGEVEPRFCLPDADDSAVERCLEELAVIAYQAEPTVFSYEELWAIRRRLSHLYICTRREQGSSFEELAETMGTGRTRYLVWKKENGAASGGDCLYAEEVLLS